MRRPHWQWKRCQMWKWDFGERSFLGSRKKDRGERKSKIFIYPKSPPAFIILEIHPSFLRSHELLLKPTRCCASIQCYYPPNEGTTYVTVRLWDDNNQFTSMSGCKRASMVKGKPIRLYYTPWSEGNHYLNKSPSHLHEGAGLIYSREGILYSKHALLPTHFSLSIYYQPQSGTG